MALDSVSCGSGLVSHTLYISFFSMIVWLTVALQRTVVVD